MLAKAKTVTSTLSTLNSGHRQEHRDLVDEGFVAGFGAANSASTSLDCFEDAARHHVQKSFCATLCVGHSGNAKIDHYSSDDLLSWGAFLTVGCYGTVFTLDKRIYFALCQYVCVCVLCAAAAVAYGDLEAIQEASASAIMVSRDLQKVTPFVFGLFVSLSIRRWWELRLAGIGAVMDSVVHLTGFLSGCRCSPKLPSWERLLIEQDLMRVVKYGVASIQAVTEQSRGDHSLDGLVNLELVTADEAASLQHAPSRAQLLWSWISVLGLDIMERCKVPAPAQNPFFLQASGASASIARIEAYHDSQLPFTYAHMMVFLIFVNNYMIAVASGCKIGAAMLENTVQWHWVAVSVLYLVLVPSFYQALLDVCFQLEDPLGEDITDFPIMMLQLRVYDASKSMVVATKAFWELEHKAQAQRAAALAAKLQPATNPAGTPSAPSVEPQPATSPVGTPSAPSLEPQPATSPVGTPSAPSAEPQLATNPVGTPSAPSLEPQPAPPPPTPPPPAPSEPLISPREAPPFDARLHAVLDAVLEAEVSKRLRSLRLRLDSVDQRLELIETAIETDPSWYI